MKLFLLIAVILVVQLCGNVQSISVGIESKFAGNIPRFAGWGHTNHGPFGPNLTFIQLVNAIMQYPEAPLPEVEIEAKPADFFLEVYNSIRNGN